MILVKCESCQAVYEVKFQDSVVRLYPWIECEFCGQKVLEGQRTIHYTSELIYWEKPEFDDLTEESDLVC